MKASKTILKAINEFEQSARADEFKGEQALSSKEINAVTQRYVDSRKHLVSLIEKLPTKLLLNSLYGRLGKQPAKPIFVVTEVPPIFKRGKLTVTLRCGLHIKRATISGNRAAMFRKMIDMAWETL